MVFGGAGVFSGVVRGSLFFVFIPVCKRRAFYRIRDGMY